MSLDPRVDMAGAAHLVLVLVLAEGVHHLQPAEAVPEAMVGWATQRSRRLGLRTIEHRLRTVRRFDTFCNDYPWNTQPADLEDWSASLQSEPNRWRTRQFAQHHQCLAMYCSDRVDSRYGRVKVCEERFGTHPIQIAHEWNTVDHSAEYEGRPGNRPFTREELRMFLDYADERVVEVSRRGRKGC